jgi:hypothetical protein
MGSNVEILRPLHALFESTCVEVFESLHCTLKKVDQVEKVVSVNCSYINASSDEIALTLLLRGPISILKKTYPIKDNVESIKPAELDDWISELANRFMGSLKNKLISYEHSLQLGIPVNQCAIDFAEFLSDDYNSFVLHFDIGYEIFECSLHAKILNNNISFNYNEVKDDSDDGELEMF